jgi:hypothetical protein
VCSRKLLAGILQIEPPGLHYRDAAGSPLVKSNLARKMAALLPVRMGIVCLRSEL